jgi:hypothetical protein
MVSYGYPTALELEAINQIRIPRLQAQRPIFDIFPTEETNDYFISWEQEDSYTGLAQVRGLNGQPQRVIRSGVKRFVMEPGVYGEFSVIDERELTTRRPAGSLTDVIDISDLVMKEDNRLLGRQFDRMELMGWTLLATGTFSVAGPDGTILHTDSYTTQTFTAAVTWATSATATPLADLRAIKLKTRGFSVRFDSTATVYMNSTTANALYSNTNAADLYGRRTQGLGTFNSLDQVNTLLTGDNLPQIREYDEGYLDDSGTFQLFIPNNKAIVVGNRTDGSPIGKYKYCRNANNPDLSPGPYTRIVDEPDDLPRHIEVHRGHNGGIALHFPSAIVVASV